MDVRKEYIKDSKSVVKWKTNDLRNLVINITDTETLERIDTSHLDNPNKKVVQEKLLIASMGITKEETSKRLNVLDQFIETFIDHY